MNISRYKSAKNIQIILRSKIERSDNRLEYLSSEIFYEIFEYLDGCDIYEAFSNLNSRFQYLLTHLSLPLKVDLSSRSKSKIQQYCIQIISIRLSEISIISTFFNVMTFNRLESLVLNGITGYKFRPLLLQLTTLPRLFSFIFNIEEELPSTVGSHVYSLVFGLPVLKYTKISSMLNKELISDPIGIHERFSSIEHLSIDHHCTLNNLTDILSHTLQLSHLTCQQLSERFGHIAKEVRSLELSKLSKITLHKCHLSFDVFEIFIRKISSGLQVLRLTSCRDSTYLDADRWKRLIVKHMPHLRKFEFEYRKSCFYSDGFKSNHALINRFRSPFWNKRQWYSNVQIKVHFYLSYEIIFTIHPYKYHVENGTYSERNTIQNVIADTQEIVNFSIPAVQSVELIVNCNQSLDEVLLLIQDLGLLFTTLDITCSNSYSFHQSCNKNMSFLPNLSSLRVSSLYEKSFVNQEKELRCFVSNNNKITKVSLTKMVHLEEIQFFINLCPRMEYLEIDHPQYIDLKTLTRFILMKIFTEIPHLYNLCLCDPGMNNDIVHTLRSMINIEKLLHDYTINRTCDKIFLKWK